MEFFEELITSFLYMNWILIGMCGLKGERYDLKSLFVIWIERLSRDDSG
jgi:hypothetical protein